MAVDTSYPNNIALTDVMINVICDANAPRFSQPSYTARISEVFPVGGDVKQITATDADEVSSKICYLGLRILIISVDLNFFKCII